MASSAQVAGAPGHCEPLKPMAPDAEPQGYLGQARLTSSALVAATPAIGLELGVLYVLERSTGALEFKLWPADADLDDGFGLHLFSVRAPDAQPSDGFAMSRAIGEWLIAVGAPLHEDPPFTGSVYLFRVDNSALVAELHGSPARATKRFGSSRSALTLAVSDAQDSEAALYAGAAYVMPLAPCHRPAFNALPCDAPIHAGSRVPDRRVGRSYTLRNIGYSQFVVLPIAGSSSLSRGDLMRAQLLPFALLALLATPAFGQGFDLSYGADPHLLFDWYVPSSGQGPFPCVVYIHGGPGDKSDASFTDGSLPDLFLKNEISLMAINHRPSPEFAYPAQLEDSATAVQFFREHAATYNIDPNRLAIWGVSSGAVIGGWLAYGPDLANPNGSSQEQQSTRPQALLNVSGLTNFLLMSPASPSYIFPGSIIAQLDPVFLKSVSFSEMVLDVSRAFTPPVVSFYGWNENPPPLTDPHDATLMKDLHQNLQAFPAVHATSKMVQKLQGVFNNNYEDMTAWLLKRFGIPHQLNLGRSLAGTGGVAPKLVATGNWVAGGGVTVSIQASTPSATTLWLLASHNALNLPFGGGTLVPEPTLMFTFVTAPNGTLSFSAPLPPWLAVGEEFYLQFWQADPQGPNGFAASNAVFATIGL